MERELKQEERKSVNVDCFLSIVRKYTDLSELTPEILREFIDRIIIHASDKSSGKRLQEIEVIITTLEHLTIQRLHCGKEKRNGTPQCYTSHPNFEKHPYETLAKERNYGFILLQMKTL